MFSLPNSNVVINGGTFSVTNISHGRKGLELLKEGTAPGAFHNSSERYDPPKCHPQTRLAVLEAIMDWIKDGQRTSFFMWLFGPAGAGKSAIAQSMAEICQELGFLVASFFWSRNAAGRNDEKRLIASLAYQLVVAIPQMRIHVETVIDDDPLLLSRSLEVQMESLIIKPLEKTFLDNQEEAEGLREPKVIILDGLDECSNAASQAYILKVISTAVPKLPIRIHVLIASRPEQKIRESFSDNTLHPITIRLALDDTYRPNDDIRLFLVDSFTAIKKSHVLKSLLPNNWPTTAEIDNLVEKSSGQFIYAATVVKFVKDPRRRPNEQLKTIFGLNRFGKHTPFAELDALYLHILSTVEDYPRVLDIMNCLFFLDQKSDIGLTMDKLEYFLSYSDGDLHLILIDLHSVIYVPDIDSSSQLRIFHASLQDFLMDPNRAGNFYLDEGIARARLTQCFLGHIPGLPVARADEWGADDSEYFFSFVQELLSADFTRNCLKGSLTRELLQDFLNFDFKKWFQICLHVISPWKVFEQVMSLSAWFREQESGVKEHLGSEMSLYAYHSHNRDLAINQTLKEALKIRDFRYGDPNMTVTAFTHPLLLDGAKRLAMLDVFRTKPRRGHIMKTPESIFAEEMLFRLEDEGGLSDECILEVQTFLQDRGRARSHYVDSGMYAVFSLHIGKTIFEPTTKYSALDYAPSQLEPIVRLAIETLPFYLSNAGYTSELAEYFLSHTFDSELPEGFYPDTQPLQDAIDLYLKKKPRVKASRKADGILRRSPRKRQRQ